MTIPRYIVIIFSVVMIVLLASCWWMSLSIYGGRSYELGKMVERNQNPAKEYIENGLPFVWYKGTYHKATYIGARRGIITFQVMEAK